MCKLKICRVCLSTNVKGYSLDSHSLREVYGEITGTKLNLKDGFPYWVCFECAALLHKFHKFKEKCHHGLKVLRLMQQSIQISYKSVSQINRSAENLNSPFSVVVANKHVNTYVYKYVPRLKKESKKSIPTIEHIYYDNKYNNMTLKSGKNKNTIIHNYEQNNITKQYEDIIIPNTEKDNIIKLELVSEVMDNVSIDADHADNLSIEADLADNVSVDADNMSVDADNVSMDADYADNVSVDADYADNEDNDLNHDNASSNHENIFDIIKKTGDNQLVFLDAKNSIIDKTKPNGFVRTKKVHLPSENWKRHWLTEEEAAEEFKKKECDVKYAIANYRCYKCFKWFSKQEILIRHDKLKHDESQGSMECKFCCMRFKLKYQLSKHMVQHYAVFECLRCDMKFHLESSAIAHEKYHNGVVKKCKECGKEFKHSSTLYTHMRMSHRSAHICNLCGESYVSEAGLAQHSLLKHLDNKVTETSTKSSENYIYCEKCDLKFFSSSAYIRHLSHSKLHIDEINDKNLKEPKKKPRIPTTCINCGKHFQTQSACMKHHLSEHPGKTFYSADHRHICEVCGASLAAGTIAYHMNKHTRERLHPCDICGMQFTMKANLRRHQATHTGARPYPCPLCEKRFTQKNSMQLHYRTVHLKQPYPKRNRKRKSDEMSILES